MEGYEGVAALSEGAPSNTPGMPGAHPCNPPWLCGRGRVAGRDWAVFFHWNRRIFRDPRALSEIGVQIETGWGSKGEGLLPFTFGWVASISGALNMNNNKITNLTTPHRRPRCRYQILC